MSKIKKRKKSLRNKTILIIVLLVIATILGIIFCFLHIRQTVRKNNPNYEVQVSKINEDSSIQDILKYYGCTNISYSIQNDKEGKLYHEIYVNFKYDLYTNNKSNQEYFESIISDLNKKLYRSYMIKDEKNGIDIFYDYESKEYTINGIEDYFENNFYNEVEEHKSISKVEALVDSSQINKIISSNWRLDKLKRNEEIISSDDNFITYETYKFNYTNMNINYVIFNSDFDESIIKDIKVGTSFKEIQQKLGTPTFKNSNKMIGYKTSNIYVFFYSDEVVVYPCKDYSNSNLESLIFSYYEGSYDGYATNLVVDILDECIDINSEIIDNYVRLYSYVRGIEIIIKDDMLEITVYDNYNLGEQMRKYAKAGIVNIDFEDDSVNLFEQERYK